MASFRGQGSFPMVSGDVPRCTKEVSRKKTAIIFLRFKLFVGDSRDSSFKTLIDPAMKLPIDKTFTLKLIAFNSVQCDIMTTQYWHILRLYCKVKVELILYLHCCCNPRCSYLRCPALCSPARLIANLTD